MVGLMAALTGGAVLGQGLKSGIDYGFSSLNWLKQVKQEQQTYERNRADYLADLENERKYNSPKEMINRIREAGLNPNLINGGQLVSAGASSGATPMPMGSTQSPDPVVSDNLANTVIASSNASANFLKAKEEIASIKLSNEYKKIENQYLRQEKELSLKKTQAEIDSSLADAKKKLSDIDVNNSTITINGKHVNLIDSQIDINNREAFLVQAKTLIANLDAIKLAIMLPYVKDMQLAELQLKRANTDLARQQAITASEQANLYFAEALAKNSLVDAGWADAVVQQLKSSSAQSTASAGNLEEDTKYIGHRAKSQRRSANAQTMMGIASLINSLANAGTSIYSTYSGSSAGVGMDLSPNPTFAGGGM